MGFIPGPRHPNHPKAAAFDVSVSCSTSRVRFTRIPAGMRQVDWHRVLDRVPTVGLNGSVEYETRESEAREVAEGEFVINEDTHGKGHLSRHSPETLKVFWISRPNGLKEPLP